MMMGSTSQLLNHTSCNDHNACSCLLSVYIQHPVPTHPTCLLSFQVDLLPANERGKLIKKAAKRLAATFALTKFAGVAMIPVAARPGVYACCKGLHPYCAAYQQSQPPKQAGRKAYTHTTPHHTTPNCNKHRSAPHRTCMPQQ